jgi:hypothetical protein
MYMVSGAPYTSIQNVTDTSRNILYMMFSPGAADTYQESETYCSSLGGTLPMPKTLAQNTFMVDNLITPYATAG